jgi:1,4-dihydroxy-2-naphthoate octaprenyltransferase
MERNDSRKRPETLASPPPRRGGWARFLRAYSFPVSVAGALAGAAPQPGDGARDLPALALFLFSVVSLHAAGNLFNDRDDFLFGVDPPSKSGAGCVASGERTPREAAFAAFAALALAALSGAALLLRTGRLILLLPGLAGALGGFLYAKGRRSPKHLACGELWIFLVFGLALPAAARWAVAENGAPRAVLLALPVSLWTTLLLYVNNWRDRAGDTARGVRTLAGRLHARFGERALPTFAWLLLAASAALPAAALFGFGPLPRAAAGSLAVVPAMGWLLLRFARGKWGRAPMETVSLLELAFSALHLTALWYLPMFGKIH